MTTSLDLRDAVCTVCVHQISVMEAKVDYVAVSSQAVSEVVALPSTAASIGDSFCQCQPQEELSQGFSDCLCGEEDQSERNLRNTEIHHINQQGTRVAWY